MILGLFGGSFNPPHICHALACHYALAVAGIDRIIAAPCAQHPFGKPMAPFADRVAMCRLAFEPLGDAVEVSEIEGERDGPNYTVDTLRLLRARRPADEFRLVIGSDILEEAENWKDFETVRRLAPPLVIPRGIGDRARFSLPAVSSSQIREALESGTVPHELLARNVLNYIRERQLYRGDPLPPPGRTR